MGPCRCYPNRYVWFVLLSTLDVVLTFVILWLDGREVNGIADWILQRYGIGGHDDVQSSSWSCS